jgi:two-component system, OmpR family, response regulator
MSIGKVLLIDDDSDIAAVLSNGLQRHGFVVTAFSDPKQALAQYKKKHYDMILLDIRMPGMTVFQVAKRIWAIDPDAKICFLSATEIHEREARIIFKDLKRVRFIKKPVRPADLAQTLENSITV